MALLQALLSLVSRSFGRILSAVFGWAVVALFGHTSSQQKMWLSALVAAAAAWPLLLVGVAFPKTAALVLAFVPLPAWIPGWTVRIGWIVLAAAVPIALGLVMAARRPATAGAAHQSAVTRMLRGIPITIGIAIAFTIVFVTVPVLRVVSFVRRRVDVHVPLVTDVQTYEAVSAKIAGVLDLHRFDVEPTAPPWWMTAPSRVLRWFDRASFQDYVPERLAYFRGPRLEAALYPNGLLLRGRPGETARAHSVVVEALTATPGLQTFDPAAQDIEKQIRSVWWVYSQYPAAHRQSKVLLARLAEIGAAIRQLPVAYDEWQIVYRQALQLGRALQGEPQLLEQAAKADGETEEEGMNRDAPAEMATVTPIMEARSRRAESFSTRELLGEISDKATLLVKKEVELARNEIKADLKSELAMAKGFAVALVAGLMALNMLLVALVFALAQVMPGWLAALVVAGSLLVIAAVVAYVSWQRRVTSPLALTRKTLKEDMQWAKERLA